MRFYEPTIDLNQEHIFLSLENSHHVIRVMRAQLNDNIIVFNGDGFDYLGTIIDINPKTKICKVKIIEQSKNTTESPIITHLGQAITRSERMDYTLQKAVELGVNIISPILTEKLSFKLNAAQLEKKTEHWQKIIISACQQSGRGTIPVLNNPVSLDVWCKSIDNNITRIIFDPTAPIKLSKLILTNNIAFLIGPEAGLTAAEINLATNKYNFTPVKLGPRILRTETVAPAVLGALQFAVGDF